MKRENIKTRRDLEIYVSERFESAAHWGDGWGDAVSWSVDACLEFARNEARKGKNGK